MQDSFLKGLAHGLQTKDSWENCLWPAEFAEDTPECAYRFLMQCETWNEANREETTIPDKEYIRWLVWHWWDTRRLGEPLIIEKSRRIIVSWVLTILDVWDAGLKPASILIGAKKYEGETGSQGFVWRCWFVYDKLRSKFAHWPKLTKPNTLGNVTIHALEKLVFPNGSKIECVNSDGEAFRGAGTTRARAEELSSYAHASHTFGQAIVVCQGAPDRPGGHPVAVCNASPDPDWQDLKAGPDEQHTQEDWPRTPFGCEVYKTFSGARRCRIHYTADPEKRSAAWKARARVGIPDQEWNREMELDDRIYDGLPVYPTFVDKVHCPARFHKEKMPYIPGSMLIGGWDCGTAGLRLAFSLLQITPHSRQIQLLLEVAPWQPTSMEIMAPAVIETLRLHYPNLVHLIRHVGDQTVINHQGATSKSSYEVAMEHGITIKPASNNWHKRHSSVDWALSDMITETAPRFVVCQHLAPVAAEALRGGFQWKKNPHQAQTGAATVVMKPIKNMYSHIADAIQYGVMTAKSFIEQYSGQTTQYNRFDPDDMAFMEEIYG